MDVMLDSSTIIFTVDYIFQFYLLSVPARDQPFELLYIHKIKTGGRPVSAILSHFRSDTNLDAVVIDQQNKDIAILRANGDETFLTPENYLVGNSPRSVISADFNNDNKLDLVVANTGDNTISVLLGKGNGIFQTAVNYTIGN